MKKSSKLQNQFPKGWDTKRLTSVLQHYEGQSEDDAVAEDEMQQADPYTSHLDTMWAVVRDGKIELLANTKLPDGVRLLVTVFPDAVPGF